MTDDEFAAWVRHAIEPGDQAVADLAEALGVSKPTVRRWASGASRPHPRVRHAVENLFAKMMKGKGDD